MKALCELIKGITLDKALLIADEAAGYGLNDIDDILQACLCISRYGFKIILRQPKRKSS